MTDQDETSKRSAEVTRGVPATLPASGRKAESRRQDAGFSAQVLGAGGQRRGLRGGPPVLEAARNAYLEAQWSGPDDRRASRGMRQRARI